jgi:hypothetical protein
MGARTLPLDSGSALVEAREKKAAQGNRLDADRCHFSFHAQALRQR